MLSWRIAPAARSRDMTWWEGELSVCPSYLHMYRSRTPSVHRGNDYHLSTCRSILTRFVHLQGSHEKTVSIRKNCRREPYSQVTTLHFKFWTASQVPPTSVFAFELAPQHLTEYPVCYSRSILGFIGSVQFRSELGNNISRGHVFKELIEFLYEH